jgi:hypothetical protein
VYPGRRPADQQTLSALQQFVATITERSAARSVEEFQPTGTTAASQRKFATLMIGQLEPALAPFGLAPIAAWYEPDP